MVSTFIDRRLLQIKEKLDGHQESELVTVRELISWFGSTRRGGRVVYMVRHYLKKHGLSTAPDFESVSLDSTVYLYKTPDNAATIITNTKDNDTTTETTKDNKTTQDPPEEIEPPAELVSGAVAEPAYRVSRLIAANFEIVSVKPDDTLIQAITLMLRHDYSQLPVMTNDRDVKGVISWESIGPKLAFSKNTSEHVRGYMRAHNEIKASDSIFAAIPRIVDNNYVLVRAEDRKIIGIITTADLSIQFKQLSEPFLLLSEIENHIRKLIDDKFTKAELKSAADPNIPDRDIETVADLTFGEYIRIVQNPKLWPKTGIKVDQKIFATELEKVRTIRNDVMHFDPDGISEENHRLLHHFVRFIHEVQSLTA